MYKVVISFALCLLTTIAAGATKPHVVVLGKGMVVNRHSGQNKSKPDDLRLRPLWLDGKLKDYTTGSPHDVTESTFVVRRALRVNDTLPGETQPQWVWERGTWLIVDRLSGRITSLNLPDFDPEFSEGSWYRDYVAYCSPAAEGHITVIIAQLGRRKPLFRKAVESASVVEPPTTNCPAFVWSRNPARVDFQIQKGKTLSFTIRAGISTVSSDEENDDSPSE